MGAAAAEARKCNWNVAIAVVDSDGMPVRGGKFGETQTASANLALERAHTSAMDQSGLSGVTSAQDGQIARAGARALNEGARRAWPRQNGVMSEHTAQVDWQRQPAEIYTDQRYQRRHLLRFDGGAVVAGSSAPTSVPRYSDPAAVDPEEMFVAALASCHMLWFLSLAAQAGHVIDRYLDDAVGTLAHNDAGRLAMTRVVLRPQVSFRGGAPAAAELDALHHRAHEACFIAQSVHTEVLCEPRPETAP